MAEALQTGLQLLLVGMITVFAVLTIVVLSGRALISLVNAMHFDVLTESRKTPSSKPYTATGDAQSPASDKSKIAAVIAAVMVETQGEGRVRSIEKLDKK